MIRQVSFAVAFDCFTNRLPLNIGCDSADTSITSIEQESSSTLYFGGWSKCSDYLATSATQSALVGKSDISQFQWLKTIDSALINRVEQIYLHSDLFVLFSSDTNSHIYYIGTMSKTDGTLITTKKIDTFTSLEANTLSSDGYSALLLAPRAADVYLAVKTSDNSEMGFLRLQGFSSSNNIQWYSKLTCGGGSNSLTKCLPTALAESSHSSSFLYFASMHQDTSDDSTQIQIRHFDNLGSDYWTAFLDLGAASMSNYYQVKKMLADGNQLIAISEYTTTQDLLITVFGGLSSSNHNTMPSSQTNFKVGQSNSLNLKVKSAWVDSTNLFILAFDSLTVTSKLVKLDLATLKRYIIDISSSQGFNFEVFDSTLYGSATQFYFGGYSKGFTDGTKSQSFTYKQGFIMISDTSLESSNCLSITQDWSPTTGGTTVSNESSITFQLISSNSLTMSLISSLVMTSSSLSLTLALSLSSYVAMQQWCMGASDISLSPPSDLGNTLTSISYTPGTQQTQQFQAFTTSGGTNCDSYSIIYTLTSTRTNADTTVDDFSSSFPTYDMSTSPPVLTFSSTDSTYSGTLNCILKASLPNSFPTESQATFTVTVVDVCEQNTMTIPSSITAQSYTVNSGFKTLTPDGFTILYSSCTVTYQFSFTAYDQSRVQSFLTYSGSVVQETAFATSGVIYASSNNLLNKFYANIADNNVYGKYTVKVQATNAWTIANSLDISYSFDFDVLPDCSTETITVASAIPNTVYTIYDAPLEIIFTDFVSSNIQCQITYQVFATNQDVTDPSKLSGQDRYITTYTAAENKISMFSEDNYYANKNIWIKIQGTFAGTSVLTEDTFKIATSKYCGYASHWVVIESVRNRKIDYQINYASPTTQVESISGTYSTNDTYCDITYPQMTYDSTVTVTNWQDNSFQLGQSYSLVDKDWIWQVLNSDEFNILTGDNADEANDFSTNGPLILHSSAIQNGETVSTTFTLYIYPDCSQETVNQPSTAQADQSYRIYDSQIVFTAEALETSRNSCPVNNYVASILPSHGSDFITFNTATRKFSVQTNNNTYGDQTYTITISGSNAANISDSYTFSLHTVRHCEYVTLVDSSFLLSEYEYRTTNPAISIDFVTFTQVADIHATNLCPTYYDLYYRLDSAASYTLWDSSIQNFITSFVGTQITIYSIDDSYHERYQIKIVAKVDPVEGGIETREIVTNLQILSICNVATFTTQANGTLFYYFVRESTKVETISQFVPSWTSFVQTIMGKDSAQLYSECGALKYYIYSYPSNSSIDSSVFSFSDSSLDFTIHTNDPDKAGSLGNYQTRYQFMVEAYMGIHYKNKAYFQFDVDIKDYCWVSKLQEDPGYPAIQNVSSLVLIYTQTNFYPFVDTITYDLAKGSMTAYTDNFPAGYNCGGYTYDINLMSPYQHKLTTSTSVVQYFSSNMTFTGMAKNNDEIDVYLINLTVSYQLYSSYPKTMKTVQMNVGRCLPDKVFLPQQVDQMAYNIAGGLKYQKIPSGFSFLPRCPYEIQYTSTFSNGTRLPSWISFDIYREARQWYAINLTDLSLVDQILEIQIQTNIIDTNSTPNIVEHFHPNVKYARLYNWTLQLVHFAYVAKNTAPYFPQALPFFLQMSQGSSLSFDTGPPSDDTGSLEVSFTPRNLQKFMYYNTDPDTLDTHFEWNPKTSLDAGEYSIMIRLYDNDDEQNPMQSVSVFGLEVIAIQEQEQVEEVIQEQVQQVQQVSHPVINIKEMDSNGVINFRFDEQMLVPGELTRYNKEKLQTIFQLIVVPGLYQDETKIRIQNFQVRKFDQKTFELQVSFMDPLYISMGETLDVLKIKILDLSLFKNLEGIEIENSDYRVAIPFQMIQSETTDQFILGTQNLQQGMNAFVYANFAISILLSASLGQLWSLMNILQLTLHLSAMNIQIPPNNSFFAKQLLSVVQFDIIPPNLIGYFYFWNTMDGSFQDSISDSRRLKEQFERSQKEEYIINNQLEFCLYDSFSLTDLLGTLYVVIIYTLVIIILLSLIRFILYLTGIKCQKFNTFYDKFIQTMFWNHILRFMLESYLEVMVATSLASHKKIEFPSIGETIENIMQIFLMLVYLSCPIVLFVIILVNRKKIEREDYWIKIFSQSKTYNSKLAEIFPIFRKYGQQLFGSVKTDRKSSILLDVIFMIRRMVVAYTLVFMVDYPLFQAQIILACSFSFMFYIGFVEPYKDKLVNRQETFNEFVNLQITYTYLCYTDFVQDVEKRYLIGWITISGVCLIIIVNIFIIVCTKVQKYNIKKGQQKTQKRYEKRMKEIRALYDEIQQQQVELKRQKVLDGLTSNRVVFHTEERGQFNRFSYLTSMKQIPQEISLEMSIIDEIEEFDESIDGKIQNMGIKMPKKVEYKLPDRKIKPLETKNESLISKTNISDSQNQTGLQYQEEEEEKVPFPNTALVNPKTVVATPPKNETKLDFYKDPAPLDLSICKMPYNEKIVEKTQKTLELVQKQKIQKINQIKARKNFDKFDENIVAWSPLQQQFYMQK